jgi:hypothetical protein
MKSTMHLKSMSLAAVVVASLASGCSTVVQQSYRDSSSAPSVALLPYSGETKVYGSYHLDYDAANLLREGYAQIGTSSFKTDGHVTFDELREQAKAVGADIVLFLKVNPRSHRPMDPVAVNNDGSAHSLNPYVHIGSVGLAGGNYGGATSVGGGTSDFKGSVTSSGIPGVSSEDMAAINAPEFEYTATFWRKVKDGPRRTESMMMMGAERDSREKTTPERDAKSVGDGLHGHGGLSD